ncbi:MAG: hypothetical protein KIS96_11170 [Bauldia sp.]|nr:hypothetical protein [Bauldia sp.]
MKLPVKGVIVGVAAVGIAAAAFAQPLGNGWLLGAPDDATRFELIQDDAGGFGRAMFEASIRYERMYEAIVDGNLELAAHHWDTIEGSVSAGIVRRPGRAANVNAFLLDDVWDQVMAELESGDQARAEAAFMVARVSCMGCHQAEDVAYLNDQRMFTDLVFE